MPLMAFGDPHEAVAKREIRREVECAACRQPFSYLVEVAATGRAFNLLSMDFGAARQRAVEAAEQKLETKIISAVRPVPCPWCSHLQRDMFRAARREAYPALRWIAIGLFISAGVAALFAGRDYLLSESLNPKYWKPLLLLSAGLIALGLVCLLLRNLIARRFDPNTTPREARLEKGRKEAFIAVPSGQPRVDQSGVADGRAIAALADAVTGWVRFWEYFRDPEKGFCPNCRFPIAEVVTAQNALGATGPNRFAKTCDSCGAALFASHAGAMVSVEGRALHWERAGVEAMADRDRTKEEGQITRLDEDAPQ